MNKAIEIWNSLDLSNQTNLECARAWFMEGFAHGEILKEYTDEEILQANLEFGKENGEDYSMLTIEDIEPLIGLVKFILKKASEK